MSDVPFNDPTPLRTVNQTGHRAHVLYTKFVRENERARISQPEASWRAVDRAMDEVEKRRKAKAAELRKRKWGDAAWDGKKKRTFKTKKDHEKEAKRLLRLTSTYNMLRGLAVCSGRTVEEVAADGRTAALRKKYFEAIAECRDKKSVREAARRRDERKKDRAEREARAAKVRKRPDLVVNAKSKKGAKVLVQNYSI
jgi:hypothetical protein